MEGVPERVIVELGREGLRVDVLLAEKFADRFSRSQVRKWIDAGLVTVAGRPVTAHYRVKPLEAIEVVLPARRADGTRAEPIPIDILHEDADLIVINKPVGMVVHPAHGHWAHTLVNALLYHTNSLSAFQDPVRPGIVHRLDKDTSGVMVVAKNEHAHAHLAKQFKDHTVKRTYQVLVRGVVQHNEGVCEEPVGRAFLNRKKVVIKPSGGKHAVTYYQVIRRFPRATFLEAYPRTGRTHQIRVHMAHIGHPVLGDTLYGVRSPWIDRQALHARGLEFTHPGTHARLHFEARMPDDMQGLLAHLESQQ